MPVNDLGKLLATELAPKNGSRLVTGTVTDASVWPPLIDCGGGAVATPVVGGYMPVNGDVVSVLTDWNGKFSATRVCLGRIAKAGRIVVQKVTGTPQAAAGAFTTLTFDTETIDQGGWFNSGTSTTNVVVPSGATAGYAIYVSATGTGNWAANDVLEIQIGGTTFYRQQISGATATITASMAIGLPAGSIVTARVFNGGAARNYTARMDITPVA